MSDQGYGCSDSVTDSLENTSQPVKVERVKTKTKERKNGRRIWSSEAAATSLVTLPTRPSEELIPHQCSRVKFCAVESVIKDTTKPPGLARAGARILNLTLPALTDRGWKNVNWLMRIHPRYLPPHFPSEFWLMLFYANSDGLRAMGRVLTPPALQDLTFTSYLELLQCLRLDRSMGIHPSHLAKCPLQYFEIAVKVKKRHRELPFTDLSSYLGQSFTFQPCFQILSHTRDDLNDLDQWICTFNLSQLIEDSHPASMELYTTENYKTTEEIERIAKKNQQVNQKIFFPEKNRQEYLKLCHDDQSTYRKQVRAFRRTPEFYELCEALGSPDTFVHPGLRSSKNKWTAELFGRWFSRWFRDHSREPSPVPLLAILGCRHSPDSETMCDQFLCLWGEEPFDYHPDHLQNRYLCWIDQLALEKENFEPYWKVMQNFRFVLDSLVLRDAHWFCFRVGFHHLPCFRFPLHPVSRQKFQEFIQGPLSCLLENPREITPEVANHIVDARDNFHPPPDRRDLLTFRRTLLLLIFHLLEVRGFSCHLWTPRPSMSYWPWRPLPEWEVTLIDMATHYVDQLLLPGLPWRMGGGTEFRPTNEFSPGQDLPLIRGFCTWKSVLINHTLSDFMRDLQEQETFASHLPDLLPFIQACDSHTWAFPPDFNPLDLLPPAPPSFPLFEQTKF